MNASESCFVNSPELQSIFQAHVTAVTPIRLVFHFLLYTLAECCLQPTVTLLTPEGDHAIRLIRSAFDACMDIILEYEYNTS